MKHLQKSDVLAILKKETEAYYSTSRAVKLISLIVLHEKFGFTADDLKEYLERFQDVLDYYNKSKDYKALLKEWDDFFYDEIGEHILWENK